MSRTVFSGLLFAAAFALSTASAQAQWSADQRQKFTNECLSSCRENPRLEAARRPQCNEYCACVLSEGQKIFPGERDFERLDNDAAAGQQTAELKRFAELFPVCSRKAWPR